MTPLSKSAKTPSRSQYTFRRRPINNEGVEEVTSAVERKEADNSVDEFLGRCDDDVLFDGRSRYNRLLVVAVVVVVVVVIGKWPVGGIVNATVPTKERIDRRRVRLQPMNDILLFSLTYISFLY